MEKVYIRGLNTATGRSYYSEEFEAIRREYEKYIAQKEAMREALVKEELRTMRKQINELKQK